MGTTMRYFGAAAALTVIALVIAALASGDRLAGALAYAAGVAAVILLVLGLVQMTSAKKP